jgi:hypothetical protein
MDSTCKHASVCTCCTRSPQEFREWTLDTSSLVVARGIKRKSMLAMLGGATSAGSDAALMPAPGAPNMLAWILQGHPLALHMAAPVVPLCDGLRAMYARTRSALGTDADGGWPGLGQAAL